jgi:arylsulfatase A-like enzyme
VWVGVALQTLFLVVFAASDRYVAARTGEALRVVLTYVTVVALFFGVHLLFGKSKRLRHPSVFFVVAVFTTINVGRYMSEGPFDYGFVHENFGELSTPLGRHILGSKIALDTVALLVVVPAVAGAVLGRFPSPPWPGSRRSFVVALAACGAVVLGLPALHVSTHESVTAFAASALRFHAQTRAAQAAIGGAKYPLVRTFEPSARARAIAGAEAPRPHVILVFLESWNGLFVGQPRPGSGRSYTPVFDARAKEALSAAHFYGNSVQSSRGHFATLCSLPNVYRGKEFTDYGDRRLHCLPQVLREAGYATLFVSATAQADFEDARAYFERIGFDAAVFQEPDPTKRGPEFWGTGVQDDVFYRRLFERIDASLASAPDKPLFTVAANASNHYPFDEYPQHVPDPNERTKHRRAYAASLATADAWLDVFFGELAKRPALKDALVVLVGDHSFPADEHGVHLNMIGAYEETFRTAFMLRWPGHLAPQVLERATSQLDIAPTIADLLLLRHPTHFLGRSMLDDAPGDPVLLVQPYDGVHLAAVRWPWKLVRHEAAEQEHLYDLSTDPREERDRIGDASAAKEAALLRDALVRIHASQALLHDDRVWPR